MDSRVRNRGFEAPAGIRETQSSSTESDFRFQTSPTHPYATHRRITGSIITPPPEFAPAGRWRYGGQSLALLSVHRAARRRRERGSPRVSRSFHARRNSRTLWARGSPAARQQCACDDCRRSPEFFGNRTRRFSALTSRSRRHGTAAFFSSANAGTAYGVRVFGVYVDRAIADGGVRLDGAIAFSSRAVGFLHRPFFPDGIDNTAAYPFSMSIGNWESVQRRPPVGSRGREPSRRVERTGCVVHFYSGPDKRHSDLRRQRAALQERRAGGRNRISGDGIDQDDLIAAAGANGFSPPVGIRSDQFFVRGVRLPFQFPRSPNL